MADTQNHSMPKLYTYIVKTDSGLAPNPFWDWCTLAVCTPNHQGASVTPGDWIAGFSPKASGNYFIYAMKVDERIHMNDYFNDPRFHRKKPSTDGNWQQQYGDNFYWQKPNGEWIQEPNPFHTDLLFSDTRRPYVFVARDFWYLGRARVPTPTAFASLIGHRGVRVNHPYPLAENFRKWVEDSFEKGMHALPLDLQDVGWAEPAKPNVCATIT